MKELQAYASCDISLNQTLRVNLSLILRPNTDVFVEIVERRACWPFDQLKNLFVAFPGPDICHRVGDVQGHLQMVVVHAAVAFFHSHLVAVRGAVLVKPGRVIEVVRGNDKRIPLPTANGVSVPIGVRIRARKFSPIGPNIAPGAVALEKLNHFFLGLGKPHPRWPGAPHDSWKTRGITPSDRIIPIFLVRVSSIAFSYTHLRSHETPEHLL